MQNLPGFYKLLSKCEWKRIIEIFHIFKIKLKLFCIQEISFQVNGFLGCNIWNWADIILISVTYEQYYINGQRVNEVINNTSRHELRWSSI